MVAARFGRLLVKRPLVVSAFYGLLVTIAIVAVRTLTPEFEKAHPGWTATNRVGAIIRGMYSE